MSEGKSLAIRQLSLTTWDVIKAIAPTMHQSRLFGVSSADQAAAIMIKGAELGLSLSASFEFIQTIQNKPTLSPRGALALIHRSGELAEMRIEDKPNACTVYMKRKSGFAYELTYSMNDARNAGLVKPGSAWESYGPNMLRWRTVGFVADVVFPDILGGMKRADEFGAAVDNSGNVIEGEWSPMPANTQPATLTEAAVNQVPLPASPTQNAAPMVPVVTLADLLQRYDGEVIIVANEGRIPATDEEVAAVAAKLEGGNG